METKTKSLITNIEEAKDATKHYRNLCIAADFFQLSPADIVREELVGHTITTDDCFNILKIDNFEVVWVPCIFHFEEETECGNCNEVVKGVDKKTGLCKVCTHTQSHWQDEMELVRIQLEKVKGKQNICLYYKDGTYRTISIEEAIEKSHAFPTGERMFVADLMNLIESFIVN